MVRFKNETIFLYLAFRAVCRSAIFSYLKRFLSEKYMKNAQIEVFLPKHLKRTIKYNKGILGALMFRNECVLHH